MMHRNGIDILITFEFKYTDMETMNIDNDLHVFYVAAASFPNGVKAAWEQLHSVAPLSPGRKFYGLSRPENGGGIQYKAATEELFANEGAKHNYPTHIIRKGKYIYLDVHNYMQDLPGIGNAFQQLLAQPGLDPQGYCVEWYMSAKEVRCMIRLA